MKLCANIDNENNVLSVAWYKDAPTLAIEISSLPMPSDGSEFQCSKFKLINGEWIEKDSSEIVNDLEVILPSPEDRLAALESALLEIVLGGIV